MLLSRHLVPLVLAASVPACAISYYVMSRWMERFIYRAPIGWRTFFIATFFVAAIGIITVVLQSLRTARREPVDSIRYES